MSVVIEITSEDEFNNAINQPFSVIDFYAKWCGPCKKIAPEFETIARLTPNVAFYKMDIDSLSEIADLYQVSNLPSFIAFENGAIFDFVVGSDVDKLKKLIADLIQIP